jgi:hypothetical protein
MEPLFLIYSLTAVFAVVWGCGDRRGWLHFASLWLGTITTTAWQASAFNADPKFQNHAWYWWSLLSATWIPANLLSILFCIAIRRSQLQASTSTSTRTLFASLLSGVAMPHFGNLLGQWLPQSMALVAPGGILPLLLHLGQLKQNGGPLGKGNDEGGPGDGLNCPRGR